MQELFLFYSMNALIQLFLLFFIIFCLSDRTVHGYILKGMDFLDGKTLISSFRWPLNLQYIYITFYMLGI